MHDNEEEEEEEEEDTGVKDHSDEEEVGVEEDGTVFTRDGFGRQSMSEKRHAQ